MAANITTKAAMVTAPSILCLDGSLIFI
jgi:hypothetical protein